ncbi:MAG: hypothetical protein HC852_19380 [Acaryochloridaceae cyanobacterium RU_4_10]|nr:hypothetical protein [Acaryochloridaceae cyanobacterium RU_4_10]
MSDFYEFEKVSYLENCESGRDEFLAKSIKKLEQVFFINSKYLQEGETSIFKPFNIGSEEDCYSYLEQNFKPCFLCSPSFDQSGQAYLIFWKEDEGYYRIIQSNAMGGFHSPGGGKNII